MISLLLAFPVSQHAFFFFFFFFFFSLLKLTQGGERVAERAGDALEGGDEASGISDVALRLDDLGDRGNGATNDATGGAGDVLDGVVDAAALSLERSSDGGSGHEGNGEEAGGLHLDGVIWFVVLGGRVAKKGSVRELEKKDLLCKECKEV